MEYVITYEDKKMTFTVEESGAETAVYLRPDGLGMEQRKSEYGQGVGAGILLSVILAFLVTIIVMAVT